MLFDYKRKPGELYALPEGYNPYITFESDETDPANFEAEAKALHGPGDLLIPFELFSETCRQLKAAITANEELATENARLVKERVDKFVEDEKRYWDSPNPDEN